uniref:Zinc finger protein 414 n=1 Tax=Podarcis muralis TaxID=64176 RepID=A0A670KCE4_PODMU
MQRSNLPSPIWDNNNQLPPFTPSGQEKMPPPPAAPLAPQDLLSSPPNRARSKAEKEEGPPPLVTSPVASLGGRRYQCSGDGCRLACRSMKELLDHIRVHYRPTQSMEGKIFRCSSPGCVESFPNMQVLMEHIKVHYKPNRYFKCENCMTRFRTYRSLFKHLHSCSSAGTAAGAAPPPVPDPLPAGPLGPLPALPPGPHAFPLLEFPGPAPHTLPGPFLPYVHPGSYALPPAAVQSRLRPFLPGQGLPISNAVWKKSQGERKTFPPPAPGGSLCPPPHRHSSNSRIVWEHTRGRYNCLQCSYSTASREEVTQHVEDHRKNPSPPGRLDGEMEHPLLPAVRLPRC